MFSTFPETYLIISTRFFSTFLVFRFIVKALTYIYCIQIIGLVFNQTLPEPHSSVSSIVDLGTRGCWFSPLLCQYCFWGQIMVIATGFIPLSLLSIVSTIELYVGKQPLAWKEYCAEYWLKEHQESMDRYTGRCDMTEILLKTALNTIKKVN